jgi:hypothetical protein
MGLPYFIHLKLLSLPFIRLNGAKRRDVISRHHGGICETNCSQECSKLFIPGEERRPWIWLVLLPYSVIQRGSGAAELTFARVADSYLLFRSEVLLPQSTRYSSHGHCPGALFGPSESVFVIPLLQYILFCDTVAIEHWFKPYGYRYAKGKVIR